MKNAVLPGSYDPITVGHLEIIKRAANIFDNVTVLVIPNSEKKYLLDEQKRLELVKDAIKDIPNAKADVYNGLTVDYLKENGFPVLVKGVRNTTDFEYEKYIAFNNGEIARYSSGEHIETLLLPAEPKYSEISSTLVRIFIEYGRDFSALVPNPLLLKELLK